MKKAILRHLSIDLLKPGKFQSREKFSPQALEELADSIRVNGMVQPIVVRPLDDQYYEIVAGERRWRAAALAGQMTVACLVNFYSDEQTAAVTAVENINRVALNPIEEAKAYQRLLDDFSYSHEEIALVIGKSRSKVSNMLRLLQLAPEIQQCLIEGSLTEGHAKVLLALSAAQQWSVVQRCIAENWSVRKLEAHIKKLQQQSIIDSTRAIVHADRLAVAALESSVSERLGTPVQIEQADSAQAGWLKIKYYDYETLAGILEQLKIKDWA